MTISAEAFGQDALQFIGDLDRLSTTEAVAEGMGRITSRFGFQALFIGGHKAHPRLTFNELLLATKCPPEFQRVYHENGYIRVDPALKRALGSPQAFDFTAEPEPLHVPPSWRRHGKAHSYEAPNSCRMKQ